MVSNGASTLSPNTTPRTISWPECLYLANMPRPDAPPVPGSTIDLRA